MSVVQKSRCVYRAPPLCALDDEELLLMGKPSLGASHPTQSGDHIGGLTCVQVFAHGPNLSRSSPRLPMCEKPYDRVSGFQHASHELHGWVVSKTQIHGVPEFCGMQHGP